MLLRNKHLPPSPGNSEKAGTQTLVVLLKGYKNRFRNYNSPVHCCSRRQCCRHRAGCGRSAEPADAPVERTSAVRQAACARRGRGVLVSPGVEQQPHHVRGPRRRREIPRPASSLMRYVGFFAATFPGICRTRQRVACSALALMVVQGGLKKIL